MKSTSTILKGFDKESSNPNQCIRTDFPKFDEFTGGFKPGELVIVTGRVGMGVNHITHCMLLNTSIRQNNTVGVFSLYESRETYLKRLLGKEAGIPFHHLKKTTLTDKQKQKLKTAKELVAKAPIFITDSMSFSVQSIIAEAKERIKWPNVKLFVIHGYNLLVDNTYYGTSRKQELDIIAEKIKKFAYFNDVSFIITHELPEISSPNENQEYCPTIKEIYDNLPLTKYADLVTVLYRPEYYGIKTWPRFNESTECEAELRIVKNRNGNLDSFRLFFDFLGLGYNEVDDERFAKQPWKAKA